MLPVKSGAAALDWGAFESHLSRIQREREIRGPHLVTLAGAIEQGLETWANLPLGFKTELLPHPLAPNPIHRITRDWRTRIQAETKGLAAHRRAELLGGIKTVTDQVQTLEVSRAARGTKRRLVNRLQALHESIGQPAPRIDPDPLERSVMSRSGFNTPSVLRIFESKSGASILQARKFSPTHLDEVITDRLTTIESGSDPIWNAGEERYLYPLPPLEVRLMSPGIIATHHTGQHVPLLRMTARGLQFEPYQVDPRLEWIFQDESEPLRQALCLRWFGGLVEVALRGCRAGTLESEAAARAIYGAAVGAVSYGDLEFPDRLVAWLGWATPHAPDLAEVLRVAGLTHAAHRIAIPDSSGGTYDPHADSGFVLNRLADAARMLPETATHRAGFSNRADPGLQQYRTTVRRGLHAVVGRSCDDIRRKLSGPSPLLPDLGPYRKSLLPWQKIVGAENSLQWERIFARCAAEAILQTSDPLAFSRSEIESPAPASAAHLEAETGGPTPPSEKIRQSIQMARQWASQSGMRPVLGPAWRQRVAVAEPDHLDIDLCIAEELAHESRDPVVLAAAIANAEYQNRERTGADSKTIETAVAPFLRGQVLSQIRPHLWIEVADLIVAAEHTVLESWLFQQMRVEVREPHPWPSAAYGWMVAHRLARRHSKPTPGLDWRAERDRCAVLLLAIETKPTDPLATASASVPPAPHWHWLWPGIATIVDDDTAQLAATLRPALTTDSTLSLAARLATRAPAHRGGPNPAPTGSDRNLLLANVLTYEPQAIVRRAARNLSV